MFSFFKKLNILQKRAFLVIISFGVISLLGDIIYEGARSVNGPYLNSLGANALIVGFVVGIGEFLGYLTRLISGYFSDKTKAHWLFAIAGYSLLITVPMLSLTGIWQFAAILIVLERIGKGLRSPAKDTLLSHAAKQVGTGFGFGIAEFFDQIGATVGPLIFTFALMYVGTKNNSIGDYQTAYSLLWLPFVILIIVLFFVYNFYKNPAEFEQETKNQVPDSLTKIFWYYTIFTFVTTLGFISFAIVGYHLKVNNIVSDHQIPFLYAIAMVVDAFAAILIGKSYDSLKYKNENHNSGLYLLIVLPLLTVIVLPLVFSFNVILIFIGMIFWGIVMGAHETIMKAAIADITSIKKRGTGYGIFNVVYGLAMFLGSAIAGYLYDISLTVLIAAFISIEFISMIIFWLLKKEIKLR